MLVFWFFLGDWHRVVVTYGNAISNNCQTIDTRRTDHVWPIELWEPITSVQTSYTWPYSSRYTSKWVFGVTHFLSLSRYFESWSADFFDPLLFFSHQNQLEKLSILAGNFFPARILYRLLSSIISFPGERFFLFGQYWSSTFPRETINLAPETSLFISIYSYFQFSSSTSLVSEFPEKPKFQALYYAVYRRLVPDLTSNEVSKWPLLRAPICLLWFTPSFSLSMPLEPVKYFLNGFEAY